MSSSFQLIPSGSDDYRASAQRRLPRFLFDYIDGGANAEQTLAANTQDFQKIQLRQKVLRDVSQRSTASELLGVPASMPVALAPVGLAGMFAQRGEVQAARAAHHIGIPFTLSTVGICSIEEVTQATTSAPWFQLYMLKDRQAVLNTLERAHKAGCRTLVFTVDLPIAGARLRDVRNGVQDTTWKGKILKASHLASRPHWLWQVGIQGKPHSFGNLSQQVANPEDLPAFRAWLEAQFDASVTWEDIHWLRKQWRGQIILKGILDAEDARQALDCGIDGLIISNHGGRQLDSVPSTISQLGSIHAAVAGQVPLLLDGGVRSGVDVFKALALGAQGVLIGRPWAWALAAQGEMGVQQLLKQMQEELSITMALCGVNSIAEINAEHLQRIDF